MKLKKTVISTFFILLSSLLFGQSSIQQTYSDKSFYEGKELYEQKKYAASYRSFENFLQNATPVNAGMKQEAEYYLASNAFELRQANAEDLLMKYVADHPYTPFWDNSYYMLGILNYENEKYRMALENFRVVDDTHLNDKVREHYLYCRGYANLAVGNNAIALSIFKMLKNMNSSYLPTAKYYTGYTEYLLGNYDKALDDLLDIEENPLFRDIAPYYVIQIFYAKNNYKEVEKRASKLLSTYPNNINNAEVYRILGEKAFADSDYEAAVTNLKRYEEMSPEVLRSDIYYLGISCQKINKPKDAVYYLSKVTTQEDEMSENAYLQLGNAYVALGDIDNARMAFEVATRTNFNKTIREEALFNYALTTYESNSGFGESVTAFELFIQEYPLSANVDKAYDYLATVYLTSNNYDGAYQSILKIKNLTPKLSETKQFLEYNIGTEAFAASNYNRAVEFFTKALQSASNGMYLADVYYWRGESFYRQNESGRAVSDLTAFFNQPQVQRNVNYVTAFYSLGYAYFSQKKYSESLPWFLKYIENQKDIQTKSYADALNRIGDCYYAQRNFSKANEYYEKSMDNSTYGDYALFQSAYMQGVQKNYTKKIALLQQLISKYPHSEYGDDAMYEIGRSYVMLENGEKTVETYQNLLKTYPHSNFAARAQLEIGMVYFNKHDNNNAITHFKKVIADYPTSSEAKVALESLETIYINTNNVNAYIDYANSLGKQVESQVANKADSISFISAEKLFINGNYKQAITNFEEYIKRFCASGKFCVAAQKYLADSYYSLNQKQKALQEYDKIANEKGNPYRVESVIYAAEITFDAKDYSSSLRYFKLLNNLAENFEQKNMARLGVLRCSFWLNDTPTIIQITEQIVGDEKSEEEIKSEALLIRGKVYSQQNNLSKALNDLKLIKIDTKTAIGAEAKYTLADVYLKLNQLNNAEAEVVDFSKKGTPHQYWLARSFIVLADVYIAKNDDFQAKQYLLNLQKNYKAQDDVQEMINSRLAKINDQSKQKMINK